MNLMNNNLYKLFCHWSYPLRTYCRLFNQNQGAQDYVKELAQSMDDTILIVQSECNVSSGYSWFFEGDDVSDI